MINEDKLHRWFYIIVTVLLVVLAILKAILVCINHQWGYIPCAIIAIALFALLYGFFRLCKYLAKIIACQNPESRSGSYKSPYKGRSDRDGYAITFNNRYNFPTLYVSVAYKFFNANDKSVRKRMSAGEVESRF